MQTGKQKAHGNRAVAKREMNRLFATIISLVCLTAVSCSTEKIPTDVEQGPVTVAFRADNAVTRTQINGDGHSTSWQKGDRIALWARNGAQEFTLANQTFSIFYRESGNTQAYFTSTLPQAMPEGRYTYYAAYPLPESVEGTQATFAIPGVQDGRVSGGADIMVAVPAEASQLGPLEADPDLSLTMRHKLHVLRFYIPEGHNTLGEPVERIVVTMPQNISGKATTDITDAGAAMTLAEGSNTVEMQLANPIDASTADGYQYACAAIFPSEQYGPDDVMQVLLYSQNYATSVDNILLAGRTFAAGHVTPVSIKPSQEKQIRPKLRFRIATNNLGEDIQKITITAPDNINWDLSVNVPASYTYTFGEKDITISAPKGNTIGADDYFEFAFYNKADIEILEGKTITVTYESQSAIVTSMVTIPAGASTSNPATINLDVPYLYYEDFSSLSSSFENHTEHTVSDSGNPDAIWLNDYGLNEWSGARIGGKTDIGIRICCRYESGMWVKAIYRGRVDSAPMAAIKKGKNVKVRVYFDYSSAQSHNNGQTTYWAGTTTNTDKLKGDTDIENIIIQETAIDRDFDISETDKSYETRHTNSYDATCGPESRLSWRVGTNRGGEFGSNGNYWLYIDNIRVQIVK